MESENQAHDTGRRVDISQVDFGGFRSRMFEMFFGIMIFPVLIAQFELRRFGFAQFFFSKIELV